MRWENVEVDLQGGQQWSATLAKQPQAEQSPGVIVLHEIFGLTSEILEVAACFAERGYVALAPDLYSGGNRIACLTLAMAESSRGRPGVFTDRLESARQWLAQRPEVDHDRLAVIGFCLGAASR